MGKPVKIHKKKSFMFTTKHNSFCGVLGAVLAVFTITVVIASVIYSFNANGNIDIRFGGVGFVTILLNIIGMIAGLIGIGERDTYITPSALAIGINILMIIMWIVLIIMATR